MGEMADYYIELGEDQMWSPDFDAQDEEGSFPGGPRPVICRLCGRQNLHWDQRNCKWRLHDQRGMHVCKAYTLNEPLSGAKTR